MLGEGFVPMMVVLLLSMIAFVRGYNGKSISASPSRLKVNVLDISKIFVRFWSKFG